MSNVFHHGEGDTTSNASRLMGASHHMLPTPPPEDSELRHRLGHDGPSDPSAAVVPAGSSVTAWLEFWDFAGGASFYAFVADDLREKSLFVFFDHNVVGADLKKALMALIELGDGPLDCQHLVVCIDRRIREGDTKGLMKSLQWVGFELTTLDHWAHGLDVTSKEWLFMGMEL